MAVTSSELTVHCDDVEEACVKVNHRSYGSIVRLKLSTNTTVRIFLNSREDFNKLFNILDWDVEVEEVSDGEDKE